jgi:hypothetical protein
VCRKGLVEFYELSPVGLFAMLRRPESTKRLPQLLNAYWLFRLFIRESVQSVAVD